MLYVHAPLTTFPILSTVRIFFIHDHQSQPPHCYFLFAIIISSPLPPSVVLVKVLYGDYVQMTYLSQFVLYLELFV